MKRRTRGARVRSVVAAAVAAAMAVGCEGGLGSRSGPTGRVALRPGADGPAAPGSAKPADPLAAALDQGGSSRTAAPPSTESAGSSAGGSPSAHTPSQPSELDPVLARSELRESAIDLLERAAAGSSPEYSANAAELLSVVPARLEPMLPSLLADRNEGVRAVAAMLTGRLRATGAADAVAPLIGDRSPYVRAAAIYALSRCGRSVDPTPLATLLLTDPSPRVRSHAAFVLGELGERSAVGPLTEAAATPMRLSNPAEVRLMQLQIAEALVKLGDEKQAETIRAALFPSQADDLEAAALAAQIIGETGDKGAIDLLVSITAYRNELGQYMPSEIRLAAAAALARLGNDRGWFLADEYRDSPIAAVRAQAALVYGSTGRDDQLPSLAGLLSDPDPAVRIAAAGGVLRITDGSARRSDAGR